jgi:putative ABC transport system ATP-binding protein
LNTQQTPFFILKGGVLFFGIKMIRLKKLHKTYAMGNNELRVLKGIDLNIGAGELVSIMGPSGSGKSTLLNIIGLLDTYDSGEYQLDNQIIKKMSERQAAYFRNRFFGFIFQAFNLIPFKNAVENVALPLYYQKIGRRKRNAIALEYLDKMGMRAWADHLPGELSGGQQQRVAIARAMISKPKVILADEPTGALDTETSYEMMDLLKTINQNGVTVIIVTHEHDISARTARTIRLRDGNIDNRAGP